MQISKVKVPNIIFLKPFEQCKKNGLFMLILILDFLILVNKNLKFYFKKSIFNLPSIYFYDISDK
jgi:hypothetical protein